VVGVEQVWIAEVVRTHRVGRAGLYGVGQGRIRVRHVRLVHVVRVRLQRGVAGRGDEVRRAAVLERHGVGRDAGRVTATRDGTADAGHPAGRRHVVRHAVGGGDRDRAPLEGARGARAGPRRCERHAVDDRLALGHALSQVDGRHPVGAEHLEGDRDAGAAATRRVLMGPCRPGARQGEQGDPHRGKGAPCRGPARHGQSPPGICTATPHLHLPPRWRRLGALSSGSPCAGAPRAPRRDVDRTQPVAAYTTVA